MPDIDNPPDPDQPMEYKDWSPETTRVAHAVRSLFETWEQAEKYFVHRYGKVHENLSTARWWAARVPKPKKVDP